VVVTVTSELSHHLEGGQWISGILRDRFRSRRSRAQISETLEAVSYLLFLEALTDLWNVDYMSGRPSKQ
jgi:hypothetical protein